MLIEYKPGDVAHEAKLFGWWLKLVQDDEMRNVFTCPQTPYDFYRFFDRPNSLYYAERDGAIWFAAWFEHFFAGAMYSLWVSSDMRQTKEMLSTGWDSLSVGLERWPMLSCLVNKDFVESALAFGYTVVGILPKAMNGNDMVLCALTRENFRRPNVAR